MEDKNLDKKEHKEHKHLTGEHKLGDSGQLILFIVFLIVWITDSFFFHYSDFLARYIALYIRIPIGAIILIFSLYLELGSHKLIFKSDSDHPIVVRNGVYRLVRHPMYLSAIALYLALICFTLSIAAAVVLIIIWIFYHFISSYEEKLLVERFGDEYRKYQAEVPMWIPWRK
jgi:protein-S-isoprenylcysteine O-methyltransferase Ste14